MDAADLSSDNEACRHAARGGVVPKPRRSLFVMAELGELLEGKYRLLRRIGEGGMGAVYEAEHETIGRRLAVKLLRPELADDEDTVERFKREARAAARIGHPTITGVTDFGRTEAGELFMVMEYLDGQSLREVIHQRGPLTAALSASIACQLLSALDAAHHAGVIHRDLKPDNIFLVEQGRDFPEVRLLDFGISKIHDPGSTAQALTKTGTALGTPSYMSPEQAWGDRAIDHRSDLWSVGVVLYECATKKLPFTASHIFSLVRKITDDPFAPPSQITPGVSAPFEEVITRALQKQPEDRFQSAKEMFDALLPLVDEAARPAIPKPSGSTSSIPIEAVTAQTAFEKTIADEPIVAPASTAGERSQQTLVPMSATIAGSHRAPRLLFFFVSALFFAGFGVWLLFGGSQPTGGEQRPSTVEPLGAADATDGVSASAPTTTRPGEVELPSTLIEITARFLAEVTASSTLQEDGGSGRYAPSLAADGREETAWGAERDRAAGEWLELRFDREVEVVAIDIQSGYNKRFRGNDLFTRNHRVKRARFSIGAWSTEQELQDRRDWQTIRLSAAVRGSSLRLTVLEIYEGSHWRDLHVSELRLWGRPVDEQR
jgi:serine/threonine protein kinase